jgi:hypothetical protein
MNKFLAIVATLTAFSNLTFATPDRLPDVESDSCLAIAYKKFLDQNADIIDMSGNVMSQPYIITNDVSKIDKNRDDIIYFITDAKNIVQQLRCQ